jgi:hypothetical protein
MVAAWMNESPTSPAFEQSHALAIEWIRAYMPDEHDPEGLIEALSELFAIRPGKSPTTTPESAGRLTDLYADFYHHAEPFDPAALTHAWSSCRERSMNRDQCLQQIPEGSEQRMQIMLEGGDALQEYIQECMAETYSGPQCQAGSRRAQELLSGNHGRETS